MGGENGPGPHLHSSAPIAKATPFGEEISIKTVMCPRWLKAAIVTIITLAIVIIIPSVVASHKEVSSAPKNTNLPEGWYYITSYNDSTCNHPVIVTGYQTNVCFQLYKGNGNGAVYTPTTYLEYTNVTHMGLYSALYQTSNCSAFAQANAHKHNETLKVLEQTKCKISPDNTGLYMKTTLSQDDSFESPLAKHSWSNTGYVDSGNFIPSLAL